MTRYKGLTNHDIASLTPYERIMLHAKIEDGHLIWCGSFRPDGRPIFQFDKVGGKHKNVYVRRYLFMRAYPEVTDPWVANECGRDDCVLPAHQRDKKTWGQSKRVRPNRIRHVRAYRVGLVQQLAGIGYTAAEIAEGLKINLSTVQRVLNAANKR